MAQQPPRSFHLDNLRTFLISLVILHHAAIPYGGLGTWVYQYPYHSFGSSPPVLAFNVINQTFFMATFFLLSGYFSAIAASKRSRCAFLREKWKKLGVPTLVYSVFGPGLVNAVMGILKDGGGWEDGVRAFWEDVRSVRGVRGAVWYCALLLIFDTCYAVLRPGDFGSEKNAKVGGKRRSWSGDQTVSDKQVLLAVTLTLMLSFLLRTRWPVGIQFELLNLNMGYVPQYVLFYVTGVSAYTYFRTDLHALIMRRVQILLGLVSALVAVAGLLLLREESGNDNRDLEPILESFKGGWNRFSFVYAVWNEVTGVVLSSWLLQLFRSRYNKRWAIAGVDMARYSYPAFLVHIPVVVFFHCVVDRWEAGGVIKSPTVGVPSVAVSWAAGRLLVQFLEKLGFEGYV